MFSARNVTLQHLIIRCWEQNGKTRLESNKTGSAFYCLFGSGLPYTSPAAALEGLAAIAHHARSTGAELLVLPELFYGGYVLSALEQQQDIPTSAALRKHVATVAKVHELAIVLGYPELETEQVDSSVDGNGQVAGGAGAGAGAGGGNARTRLYNSALAVDRDGTFAANYRKTHLFGAEEKACFEPGTRLGDVFPLAGLSVSILICYVRVHMHARVVLCTTCACMKRTHVCLEHCLCCLYQGPTAECTEH